MDPCEVSVQTADILEFGKTLCYCHTLHTRLHLYQALAVSVLLYTGET